MPSGPIVSMMLAAHRWLDVSAACRTVHGPYPHCRGWLRTVQRATASPIARSAGRTTTRTTRTATHAAFVATTIPTSKATTTLPVVSAGSAMTGAATNACDAFPEPRPMRGPRNLPLPRCAHDAAHSPYPLIYCRKWRQRHLLAFTAQSWAYYEKGVHAIQRPSTLEYHCVPQCYLSHRLHDGCCTSLVGRVG